MDFVENQKIGVERPASGDDDGSILRSIEIQVLGFLVFRQELFGQERLADLTRPRDHDHFLGQIMENLGFDIAFHGVEIAR
jgi:hypothetical protein